MLNVKVFEDNFGDELILSDGASGEVIMHFNFGTAQETVFGFDHEIAKQIIADLTARVEKFSPTPPVYYGDPEPEDE